MTSTLATSLSQAFIERRGFQAGVLAEATELHQAADIVLTRVDGAAPEMVCLVDRSVDATSTFPLTLSDLQRIGRACAHYAAPVDGVSPPVMIHVVVAGPTTDADRASLQALHGSFGDGHVRAWAIDALGGEVWSSLGRRASSDEIGRFLRAVVRGEDPTAAAAVEEVPLLAPGVPIATLAIITCCTLMFALEMLLPATPADGFLDPSSPTLLALGALTRAALTDVGQSYRLLTATVLHGDALHLLFNSFALFVAGRVLEPRIGRGWIVALFVVAGLGGSVASAWLMKPAGLSIGASGAIMGLLAAGLVMSTQLREGAERTAIQNGLTQMLVPALLPVISRGVSGHAIDYGAHIGGAVTGGLATLAIYGVWRDRARLPVPMVARAIAVCGVAFLAAGFAKAPALYEEYGLARHLIPDDQMPKDATAGAARSVDLLARFPRDPRSHWLRAAAYESAGDLRNAKDQLRQSLAEPRMLHKFFKPEFEIGLRAALATLLVNERNPAEARTVAQPVCKAGPNGAVPASLQALDVCS
jgi:rhomboid protease GluP